jgi:DNA polymerase-3 subunit delta'
MKELFPWQGDTWQYLNGLRSHMPNALLLKGAEGIGKFEIGLIFAQSLLCSKPIDSWMPCCQCDSCRWFEQGTHPDFRLIQPDALAALEDGKEKESGKKPSREISVDQIRELSTFANLSAHQGGYRIVLVHPAETMNTNSANALLKTLEEPTERLFFILICHKPQQLLPTILSRCLSIAVNNPNIEAGTSWLKAHKVNNPENALALAGFAPLLALQQIELGKETDEINALIAEIQTPNKFNALAIAERLQRTAPNLVVHCLQQWCYDLASAKLTGRVRYFPDKLDLISKLSAEISSMHLLRYQGELKIAKRESFHPLNSRLQFESLFLSYRQLFVSLK